jgi:hypothetical protein
MYGNLASSGAESMITNNANDLARQKAAVDILNAAIKLFNWKATDVLGGNGKPGIVISCCLIVGWPSWRKHSRMFMCVTLR